MTQNKTGRSAIATTQQTKSKDSQCSKISGRILEFLSSGEKRTANEINHACGTTDARKYISDFGRKYGISISREWTDNGNKLFWIESSARKEVAL